METLKEAKEDVDEVDPSMLDMLVGNEHGEVYGYLESEDDDVRGHPKGCGSS